MMYSAGQCDPVCFERAGGKPSRRRAAMEQPDRPSLPLKRRSLLKASIVGGGAALMDRLFAAPVQNAPFAAGASAASGGSQPIVETTSGKIRGTAANGICAFQGVPYGASTEGKNRFMPPAKPEPWSGVRDATQYGHSAPQTIPSAPSIFAGMDFLVSGGDPPGTGESEECLVLNVWTPSVK